MRLAAGAAAVSDSAPDLLGVVWQTLVIYVGLILALRAVGRHILSQLTLLDYLIIALLGSAVETALYRGSSSIVAGLLSATVLMLTNRGIASLVGRVPLLHRFFVGTPIVLVRDGQIIHAHLRHGGMTPDDLMQGIRRRGYDTLEDVRYAVLEVDGRISVVLREGQGGER